MMNWLYYLLEANLYLALFYGCYHLLFHKETFYSINRYFLIGATLLAFALPLLQIGYLNRFFQPEYDSLPTGAASPIADEGSDLIKLGISSLYWLVAMFFSLKLLRDLYQIIALSRTTKRHHDGQVIHIELEKGKSAFSFFNLLFIPANVAGKETILKHEMVHIRQRHSLDILFFEIIQILSWFNPVSYLIKKDIKLLHEYIADELTTNEEIQKHDYALFLIRNSFGAETKQLSNQIFNPSILKQRINMLNKEKSTGRARLKLLLTLPLVGGMLCTSTMAFTKDYGLLDFYPNTISSINSNDNSQDTIKKKQAKKNQLSPAEIRENNIKFPPPIVKPDRPAARAKQRSKVKFPPPIVKPDRPLSPAKHSNEAAPPPPVDPKIVPVGSAPPPPPIEPVIVVDGPPPPPPVERNKKLRSIKIKEKPAKSLKSGELNRVNTTNLNTKNKATTNLETKNTVNTSKP
jgi:hypothetical protein